MGITHYEKQMTRKKALYHVCYKLSEWGWNTSLADGDDKGIDILCVNEEESQIISVKVKGRGKKDRAVSIPPSRDRIMGDFWIIVTELDYSTPTCYILSPDEIEEGRESQTNKEGKLSHWLDSNYVRCNIERFKENWERIGSGFIGSRTEG